LLALAFADPVAATAVALILVCIPIVLLIQARRAMRALLRLRDRLLSSADRRPE
jgi:hypothetical protein